MSATASKELTLFSFTQPELMAGIGINPKKNDKGETYAVTMTVLKRKDVARLHGLAVKGEATTKKLLEISDAMKQAAVAEFAKMAASNDFTGAGMTVRRLKDGRTKITAGLVSVNRETKSITPDQLEKALAAMTDEQRTAILAKAEELAAQSEVVDVVADAPAAEAEVEAILA